MRRSSLIFQDYPKRQYGKSFHQVNRGSDNPENLMKYDTTFKDLFPDVHVLFTLLTQSYPVKIENVEFSSIKQRRADLVAWLANQELLHLEVQSSSDSDMLWRELEYCSLIAERYGQLPHQIVLYVGNPSPDFKTEIDSLDLKFRYHLVDIRDLDSTSLLESESLSDNLLALLGKFKDKQSVMQRVLHRIARLDKNRRADMLEKLAILAGLRPAELPKLIKQELEKMPISLDLEENPFLLGLIQRGEERGEERGRQEGKRLAEIAMLRRLLAKRFGTLPEWVDARLEQASTDQLETWSLRVLDASCLEQVLTPINE